MPAISRRQFITHSATASIAYALPVAPAFLRSLAPDLGSPSVHRLTEGWEYFQGSLDTPWEVWNSAEIAVFQRISLPHCFNHADACDPDTPAYRGPGWYRTHLSINNPYSGGRTLLHFAGAGQTTDVFLGDQHMAQHVGGYDEFMVDVTDSTADQLGAEVSKTGTAHGEASGVRLAIRCDNGRDLDRMPSDLSDFTLYGGLYRPVTMIYVPAISLQSVHIRCTPGASGEPAHITVAAQLYGAGGNPADKPQLELEILDPGGNVVGVKAVAWSTSPPSHAAFPNERTVAEFKILTPRLWSPATPNLYTCRVKLSTAHGTHTVTERFGIRTTVWVDDGPFLLNGQRLFLRGTHRHEDHAESAAAMSDELIRQEMQLIKDMGTNFIRLAHYQQNRLVLDLCDELGLLVWEELTWCRAGVGSEKWKQMGREKMRNMVDQHLNHPSVLLWGLGNEDDWPGEFPSVDDTAIRAYMTEMRDLAHQLDPTRLTSFRRCDFARDIPDVYSPSIWAGWYGGRFTDYQASLENQRSLNKHLIHIEYGADSHAGRHAEQPYMLLGNVLDGQGTAEVGMAYLQTGGDTRVSRDGDWSETYACELFDWHLRVQEALPWLTGAAQWIFKDFTTPLRANNPVPRVNQKGLVERDMTPKEAFYVFQSYWADSEAKPMVRLYGHSWPVRWGNAGEQRLVRVYSNCASAELFVNGQSVGVKRRDSNNFPCAGLRWSVSFATGKNTLRVAARPIHGDLIVDELSFTYQTEPWGEPARLALTVIQHAGNRSIVEAKLLDDQGILCLDARNVIRFSLAGSGKLVDNRGTTRGSRVVQLCNGRAQISVTGRGTAAVSSEGIVGASCMI